MPPNRNRRGLDGAYPVPAYRRVICDEEAKSFRLIFAGRGQPDARTEQRELDGVSEDQLLHIINSGLPIAVDNVYPLAEYLIAIDRLERGAQLGKIVLDHGVV